MNDFFERSHCRLVPKPETFHNCAIAKRTFPAEKVGVISSSAHGGPYSRFQSGCQNYTIALFLFRPGLGNVSSAFPPPSF